MSLHTKARKIAVGNEWDFGSGGIDLNKKKCATQETECLQYSAPATLDIKRSEDYDILGEARSVD